MVMAKPLASSSTTTAWAACSTVNPRFQRRSSTSLATVIPVDAAGGPVVVLIGCSCEVGSAPVSTCCRWGWVAGKRAR